MHKLQSDCVYYGVAAAYSDIFGDISNELVKIIKKRKKLKYPVYVYSNILGNPMEKSLTEQACKEIQNSPKSKDKELLEKYFWLNQGYIGRGLTKEELNEIRKHDETGKEFNLTQKELIKELKLSKKEENIFKTSQNIIFIKSLRADSRQFIHVLVNRLIDRLSKDWNIKTKYLESSSTMELSDCLLGKKKLSKEELKKRWNHSIIKIKKSHEMAYIYGEKVKDFLNKNVYKEKIEKQNKIKGQIAQPGKVKGKVKLVFGPQHNKKVEKGNILVSIATSPQLLPAMKRASAFVTDVGGITCHAAIVSRELKKPCVVGTKIATKVLRDGDSVEVDANKGVVKILKKK
ncbi:hypothetical protein KAR28_03075 [Candidatus Parcubacteria bacterium]|nr:hypothetical protein [Candidatus Parcubacteria bacterium]